MMNISSEMKVGGVVYKEVTHVTYISQRTKNFRDLSIIHVVSFNLREYYLVNCHIRWVIINCYTTRKYLKYNYPLEHISGD